ncbi:hypothetical protein [Acinetobacter sp.]|uniref:hypothetical protein n=1 Tax=Acinetobacter sp. TaxID=472 RepID=UPI0025835424|nr:hypothetical protein [Acinetobacter sp.]
MNIELTCTDIALLADFREELTPRFISDCGHCPEMSKDLVKALYKVLNEKLSYVLDHDLPKEFHKKQEYLLDEYS